MACKPGDITQLTCTGEQICSAVEQTASQAGQLTDHENRITVNTNQIIENTANISDLDITVIESRVDQNEINIANNTVNISGNSSNILNNKDNITTNTNNINILQTLSSSNLDKINDNENDITTNTNNISDMNIRVGSIEGTISSLPTTYAKLSGSTIQTFDVANPTSSSHAMNQSWGDSRYEFVGVSYTKAESDNQYLAKLGTAIDSARLGSELAEDYVLKTLIATDIDPGIVREATDAEAAAGTATDCYVTPKQMADYVAANP